MVVLLRASRASRARHPVPRRRPVPVAALLLPRPMPPGPPTPGSRLLALVDDLLAAVDCLEFMLSGAWLLP